jgi:tRNA(adenine34) deaminase
MIEKADKNLSGDHEQFMLACIKLARIAKNRGDSPVGSILVLEGQIIGEGIEGATTRHDVTFHAEIEAIRRGREFLKSHDLSRCILYTTHEPCIMCSYVIRQATIHTVVIGIMTGEIGGFSSQFPLLTDSSIKKWVNPPRLITAMLENECRNL